MPNSFLEDYLLYSTTDEAPTMFHLWCGFGAMSAIMGRRCWLNHGENSIFPNLYILLVGEAGGGKSTALTKARRMIAEIGTVPCTASVETVEGLIRVIAGEGGKTSKPSECYLPLEWPDGVTRGTHNMVITANEFVDMIRSSKETWTGFLCNVYDENFYSYRTKGQGHDKIEGPYICLLGAVPTDISKDMQAASIITSGLARRTLFQYGERRFSDPKAFPTWSDKNKEARVRCIARLHQLQTFRGEMRLSDAAREWWVAWYNNHSITTPERATPATQGWLSSKPNQIQKLAMLCCLSDSDLLIIEPRHFEFALASLNDLEKDLHHIFGGVGRNDIARVVSRFDSFISSQNTIISEDLLKRNFFTEFDARHLETEFSQVLQQLARSEKIVRATIKTTDKRTLIVREQAVVAASQKILDDYMAKITSTQKPASAPTDSTPDVPPPSGQAPPPSV